MTELPRCVVYGNCQAPALRDVLRDSPAFAAEYDVVCAPVVHTATRDDLDEVERLVRGASLIVTQPIKEHYRGMALGTDEITAAAPRGCRVIRFPVLFYRSLFPFQVHLSREPVPAPMTVAYHDLRLLYAAAEGMGPDGALEWLRSYVPDAGALKQLAAKVAETNRRYELDTDVKVFDRFTASPAMHRASFFTINHPTRQLLRVVAEQVHSAVGLPFTDEGTDEFLGWLRTPLEPAVLSGLGLPANGDSDWVINGEHVHADAVARAHLDFYRARPEVLAAALEEHGPLLRDLGLGGRPS
jgi:hypothetical protein